MARVRSWRSDIRQCKRALRQVYSGRLQHCSKLLCTSTEYMAWGTSTGGMKVAVILNLLTDVDTTIYFLVMRCQSIADNPLSMETSILDAFSSWTIIMERLNVLRYMFPRCYMLTGGQ
jgi:hypothetical protein